MPPHMTYRQFRETFNVSMGDRRPTIYLPAASQLGSQKWCNAPQLRALAGRISTYQVEPRRHAKYLLGRIQTSPPSSGRSAEASDRNFFIVL